MKVTYDMPSDTIEDLTYPVLMQSSTGGFIVLFTEVSEGAVVATNNADQQLGYHSECWMPADDTGWHKYEGTITLEND